MDIGKTIEDAIPDGVVEKIFLKVKLGMVSVAMKFESKGTLFVLLRIVMEEIELENLKGCMQKQLAEAVMVKLVHESSMGDVEKEICEKIITEGLLGDSIDVIIAATKGDFKINKKTQKKLLSCLKDTVKAIVKSIKRK